MQAGDFHNAAISNAKNFIVLIAVLEFNYAPFFLLYFFFSWIFNFISTSMTNNFRFQRPVFLSFCVPLGAQVVILPRETLGP